MAKSLPHTITLFMALFLFSVQPGFSCSMYKITMNGTTVVGCNEDAWRLTPHIWFENGTNPDFYGAAFTGSRFDGANGYAPQSGMNEFGLIFSRLASHTPGNKPSNPGNKKLITHPTFYLKDILHTCKTVEEVKDYIEKYDHSYFLEDVFIYIDPSGKYLVVEPYTMTIGNEPSYVLSNFCPSATPEAEALKLDRYRKGVEFLKTHTDTSLAFCTALSDTMHVCREKIGDGTLLTSIWDPNKGTVNLYFYHNYQNVVQFNIKEELAKGDHILQIQTLFPPNKEFDQLRDYKTPENTPALRLFLFFSGCLFFFSSFFFLVSYFRSRKKNKYAFLQLALFPLNLFLFYYMYVLFRHIYIFYFSSPYVDPGNIFISMSSYIPFVLVICLVPLVLVNRKIVKEKTWSFFARTLFTFNNIIYCVLTGWFTYWGLFNVFN